MAEEYRKYRSSEWYTAEEIDEYERFKLTKEVSEMFEEKLQEKDVQLSEKDAKLSEKDAEIEELKRRLAKYESQDK